MDSCGSFLGFSSSKLGCPFIFLLKFSGLSSSRSSNVQMFKSKITLLDWMKKKSIVLPARMRASVCVGYILLFVILFCNTVNMKSNYPQNWKRFIDRTWLWKQRTPFKHYITLENAAQKSMLLKLWNWSAFRLVQTDF